MEKLPIICLKKKKLRYAHGSESTVFKHYLVFLPKADPISLFSIIYLMTFYENKVWRVNIFPRGCDSTSSSSDEVMSKMLKFCLNMQQNAHTTHYYYPFTLVPPILDVEPANDDPPTVLKNH